MAGKSEGRNFAYKGRVDVHRSCLQEENKLITYKDVFKE